MTRRCGISISDRNGRGRNGMSKNDLILCVASPLEGWCASLDDSPDPVFRGRMLGDGVSIDPTVGELRAPFGGTVVTIPESRHAITLRAENGTEFLIHVGIDTVNLAGDGFEAHVSAGERVETGQLLLRFDMEKLLRGATSLRTPVLLLKSEGFSIHPRRVDGPVRFGEILFEVQGQPDETAGPAATPMPHGSTADLSRSVIVGLEHGIHARPAASLIEAVSGLNASVALEFKGKSANLSSAVALMSLAVGHGDRVELIARGENAEALLDTLEQLLQPLPEPVQSEKAESSPEAPVVGGLIRAVAASPGLVRGNAHPLRRFEPDLTVAAESPRIEKQRMEQAIRQVDEHLGQLAGSSGTGAEIARAHRILLSDPMVTEPALRNVERGKSAAAAWHEAVEQAVDMLSRVDDQRMRERVDDLLDINLRMQRCMAGQGPSAARDLPTDTVILADNLLPSELLEMDRSRIAGICLAAGGATSHVAILAMSLQIPMLVAAGRAVEGIEPGTRLLVDADLGELHVSPDAQMTAAFERRVAEERQFRQETLESAHQPGETSDGTRIRFLANVASADDAIAAMEAGAEGCGLLRTEFVFMHRSGAPGVEEQLDAYRRIATALGERPLVVRTLDAGGDKPIPYIEHPPEENPALGIRGIRLSLAEPALFEAQLQALARLSCERPVRVMLPMVSSIREVEAARSLLDHAGPDPARLKLGVMIETPAAALIADQLADLVDFFSIGTNDLAQYTLCMDRGEPLLASQLDVLHPAVLQLIQRTVQAADRHSIPVAVCGGAAGDRLAAPVLLGLGVRELSMPAGLIGGQKARLRKLSLSQCERWAQEALRHGCAETVRQMMRNALMT
jgi:phosphocarrier protein FPr/phosphocarrier protein